MSKETDKTPDANGSPPKGRSADGPAPAAADESRRDHEDTASAPLGPLVYRAPARGAKGGRRLPFEPPRISRRGLLLTGFWSGLAVLGAASAGGGLDLVYPRKVSGFGGPFSVPGGVEDYPPGTKTHFIEGRFWLVHLTEEQGGPGLLALWQKCPHLGCTVPWRDTFVWPDPETGQDKEGWFRCPCHGSTYTDAGVLVFGPAPRSMDTMKLTVDDRGNMTVHTGDITDGSPDNASRVLKA